MGNKSIILTMYGKNEFIESISVSLIGNEKYYEPKAAIEYCNNINDFELKDDNWVYASIVKENEKIILVKPPVFDIINKLPDRSLQKVLREVDNKDLVRALKSVSEETREKLFKNMSKRAASMLKEDIESLQGVNKDDIKLSQKKIIDIIQHLATTGEIIIARAE
jgi:flagellar motor switch protein FliG